MKRTKWWSVLWSYNHAFCRVTLAKCLFLTVFLKNSLFILHIEKLICHLNSWELILFISFDDCGVFDQIAFLKFLMGPKCSKADLAIWYRNNDPYRTNLFNPWGFSSTSSPSENLRPLAAFPGFFSGVDPGDGRAHD